MMKKAIRENARAFKNAFAWNEGFKEFFAVKAAPNPYLMKILHKEDLWRGLQFAGGTDHGAKNGHHR
jgi:diaminopimelate decarboxylase